jgi:hypothetical protein
MFIAADGKNERDLYHLFPTAMRAKPTFSATVNYGSVYLHSASLTHAWTREVSAGSDTRNVTMTDASFSAEYTIFSD